MAEKIEFQPHCNTTIIIIESIAIVIIASFSIILLTLVTEIQNWFIFIIIIPLAIYFIILPFKLYTKIIFKENIVFERFILNSKIINYNDINYFHKNYISTKNGNIELSLIKNMKHLIKIFTKNIEQGTIPEKLKIYIKNLNDENIFQLYKNKYITKEKVLKILLPRNCPRELLLNLYKESKKSPNILLEKICKMKISKTSLITLFDLIDLELIYECSEWNSLFNNNDLTIIRNADDRKIIYKAVKNVELKLPYYIKKFSYTEIGNEVCPTCLGSQREVYTGAFCGECRGTGWITKTVTELSDEYVKWLDQFPIVYYQKITPVTTILKDNDSIIKQKDYQKIENIDFLPKNAFVRDVLNEQKISVLK